MINGRMKVIPIFAFIFLFSLMFFSADIYAEETDRSIREQIDLLPTETLSAVLSDSDYSAVTKIDIGKMILQAVKGELDITPLGLIKEIVKNFFAETTALIHMMRNMILIIIISAIFSNLSSSFGDKSVSEAGFYVTYILIMLTLFSSFNICVDLMNDLIDDACSIMEASVPVMMTLMVLSGKVSSVYVFNPLLMFIVNFFGIFIRNFIAPFLMLSAGLEILNYLSDKDVLLKLAESMRKGISWLLKITAVLFIGILAIQGLSAPILTNTVTKSAKSIVNIVPLVGSALTSAVDTVVHFTSAVKSGTLVAIIIIIIIMCSVPLLKIAAFIVIFKITAGLIQPIADPRIVKAIDAIGSYSALALGTGAIISVLFIVASMVVMTV